MIPQSLPNLFWKSVQVYIQRCQPRFGNGNKNKLHRRKEISRNSEPTDSTTFVLQPPAPWIEEFQQTLAFVHEHVNHCVGMFREQSDSFKVSRKELLIPTAGSDQKLRMMETEEFRPNLPQPIVEIETTAK